MVICLSISSVYAEADDLSTEPESCLEEMSVVESKMDIEYTIESYQFIRDCSSGLYDNGGGDLHIVASTKTTSTVSSLKLDIYLEKLNGTSWSTVKSWSQTASSTSYLSASKVYTVPTGAQYRVRTIHTVSNGGTTEFEQTTSNTITVR